MEVMREIFVRDLWSSRRGTGSHWAGLAEGWGIGKWINWLRRSRGMSRLGEFVSIWE